MFIFASLRTRSIRFSISSLYALRPNNDPAPSDSGLNMPNPANEVNMPNISTPP